MSSTITKDQLHERLLLQGFYVDGRDPSFEETWKALDELKVEQEIGILNTTLEERVDKHLEMIFEIDRKKDEIKQKEKELAEFETKYDKARRLRNESMEGNKLLQWREKTA